MGKFIHEGTNKVEFEDRLLAHLEQVITTKLRRGECFTFTWKEDISVGGGRVTVWLHPHANLVFKFHGGRTPALNAEWLRAMSQVAAGPRGLYVVPEPRPGTTPAPEPAEMRFMEVPAHPVDPPSTPTALWPHPALTTYETRRP